MCLYVYVYTYVYICVGGYVCVVCVCVCVCVLCVYVTESAKVDRVGTKLVFHSIAQTYSNVNWSAFLESILPNPVKSQM